MPVISRRDLIRKLRLFGYSGPFVGTDHPFMIRGTMKLKIPNVHEGDIGPSLLSRILRQASISREEWDSSQ
jgi:hypothetical protein